MAVTSTPEKTAMLSISEKNIEVLDLCGSYDSCEVDEPILRKGHIGNVIPSEIEPASEFSFLPDDLLVKEELSTCCGGVVDNCDELIEDSADRQVPDCGDDHQKGDSESVNVEVTENNNATDIRSDESDKTVGTTIETDSGNGGSCCENNPDEFLDESNIDDDRDEQQKHLLSSGSSQEPNDVVEGRDVVTLLEVHDREVVVSHSDDVATQNVNDCDDQFKSDDILTELRVETNVKVPESKSLHRTATTSCSQPVGPRETAGPHIPRLQRQRMGSYGSPPPSASLARDPGSSQPFATSASGTSAGSADDDATKQQQYVVNVHVNPGETFSVCLSDQVQLIQGPATVRMVSNNGPPLPMPMQVPPGHMVQQIIDENGILTNVILSSQPPGIMAPPMMVGYYGGHPATSPYSPYCGPAYAQFAPAPYAVHHHPAMHPSSGMPPGGLSHGHPPPPPPQLHPSHGHLPMASMPPQTTTMPLQQGMPHGGVHRMDGGNGGPPLNHHCSENIQHNALSGGHPNHVTSEDRLPPRIKGRLPLKFYKHKHSGGYYGNQAPRHSIPNMNGIATTRLEPPSESSSSEEQEHAAEDRRLLCEQLSKMPVPKPLTSCELRPALKNAFPKANSCPASRFKIQLYDVLELPIGGKYQVVEFMVACFDYVQDEVIIHQVLEIEARSALIVLTPPDFNYPQFDMDISELQYELALSEYKDCKFNTVYSGDATEITLRDLKPSTDYYLKVHSMLDDVRGSAVECVSFKTLCCEPEPPSSPKLQSRTVSSITLKWNATIDNGAKISNYSLEYDQGSGSLAFVEIYSGVQRQFKVGNLVSTTSYVFRLAAVNQFGKSRSHPGWRIVDVSLTGDYSRPVSFSTCGVVPSQPDPPMLSERFITALMVSWIRRPGDDIFTLHMDDESTGQGFMQMYSGSDLSFTVSGLQRNTEYRFRLQASNEEGSSQWSDVVHFRTLCDRPRPPPRPRVKGKVHQQSFRIVWDPPEDTGGVAISNYLVQMDSGKGYELVHNGPGREFFAENLLPGRKYQVCICCVAADKQSDWSEVLSVTTQFIPPAACRRIWHYGTPQPTSLRICWDHPDNSHGSPASEYELLMTCPDRQTASEVYRGPKTEALITGLQPGRPYTFQVRALNHAGGHEYRYEAWGISFASGDFLARVSEPTELILSYIHFVVHPSALQSYKAGPWSDTVEIWSSASVPDSLPSPMVVCKSPHVAQISWCKPAENGAVITEYRLEWQQRTDFDFSLLYCGLSLTAEISGLNPATVYSFRVQAVNSAGAGPFSCSASCVTPPSSPSPVTTIQLTPSATAIVVGWRPPDNNGSPITAYHIVVDDRPIVIVDSDQLEHEIDDLQPETTYRVRIQAVNVIGCGAFSVPMKFKTKSLPPRPPSLECVAFGSNSLKLKWRDSRCTECMQYSLEMQRDDGSYHCVYRGTGHSYKVTKLNELTEYVFRICATNDAGSGPYSIVCRFSTMKSPPSAVKPPRVSCITTDSCVVDWIPLKAANDDIFVYVVQLAVSRDQTFKQIYRGPHCTYRASGLLHGTEYHVRVFAIRLAKDPGECELVGTIGLPTTFSTVAVRSTRSSSGTSVLRGSNSSAAQLNNSSGSDQRWAILLLVTFTLCAVLIAFLTQQVLLYAASSNSITGDRLSSTSALDDVDVSDHGH